MQCLCSNWKESTTTSHLKHQTYKHNQILHCCLKSKASSLHESLSDLLANGSQYSTTGDYIVALSSGSCIYYQMQGSAPFGGTQHCPFMIRVFSGDFVVGICWVWFGDVSWNKKSWGNHWYPSCHSLIIWIFCNCKKRWFYPCFTPFVY